MFILQTVPAYGVSLLHSHVGTHVCVFAPYTTLETTEGF